MSSDDGVAANQGRRVARIMLVEDEPGDAFLLQKALKARQLAHELLCYEDGEQAMEALSAGLVPDLILVDLNLPRRDGFDVLRSIRARPSLVGVPVAVFTSSAALADQGRAALIGAERYIHKPAELNEFMSQVGRAIEELLACGT